MQKFFGFDGPIFVFFEKLANLLWLNILWLVCCIPIITIGASTSAMYYVTLKMIRNEESYIAKSFFKAFKQNLKQATLVWIIIIFASLLLVIDNQLIDVNAEGIEKIVHIGICVVGFLVLMTGIYVFPLIAKFENTTVNTLKNALLLSLINAPYTVAIVAIIIIPFVIAYFYLALMPVMLMLGVSTSAYFASKIYNKIFEKLIAQSNVEDTTKEGPEE